MFNNDGCKKQTNKQRKQKTQEIFCFLPCKFRKQEIEAISKQTPDRNKNLTFGCMLKLSIGKAL